MSTKYVVKTSINECVFVRTYLRVIEMREEAAKTVKCRFVNGRYVLNAGE